MGNGDGRGPARTSAGLTAVITVAALLSAGCTAAGTGAGPSATAPAPSPAVSSPAVSSPAVSSPAGSASSAGTSTAGTTAGPASSGRPPSGTQTSSTSSAPATGPDAVETLPDGPLGDQVRWYVGVLRSGAAPNVAAVRQRFAASLLQQVPADQLVTSLKQVIALEPGQLTAFSGDAAQGLAYLSLAGGQRLLVTIAVDGSGKISALLNRPAPALPTITRPGDLVQAATTAGARSSLLVADDNCRPLTAAGSAADADKAHPLGSVFKLYVLGAVTRAVAAGSLEWTDTLTIDADIRSFPSGQLQDSAPNTEVTVQQAATLMISISDNTATDALTRAVGPRAVEAAVRSMGSQHPGLLAPFPTTKQIFALAADPGLRTQWAATFDRAADGAMAESTAAQVRARRALIEQIPDALPGQAAFAAAPAGWPDGVEWFASAADICRAQVALHELAQTPAGAPLGAILTKNPGVVVPDAPAGSIAFKGGSDTGVLTGSWLVEREDGSVRVLVWMMRGDTAAEVPDEQYYAAAARGALESLVR